MRLLVHPCVGLGGKRAPTKMSQCANVFAFGRAATDKGRQVRIERANHGDGET